MAEIINTTENTMSQDNGTMLLLSDAICPPSSDTICFPESNVDFSGMSYALTTLANSMPQYDCSTLSSAFATFTERIPKIDTSIMTDALKGTADLLSKACVSGLSDTINGINEKAIASVLPAVTIAKELPDTKDLLLIDEPDSAISPGLSTMLANMSSFLSGFISKIKEMFSGLQDKIKQVLEFLGVNLSDFVQCALYKIHAFIKRTPRLPQLNIVIGYRISALLRPTIPLSLLTREYLEHTPTIRGIYLHKGRERGTSSDADICLSIV